METSVETTLEKFGLTKTETALYVAGLSYTGIGVHELEKITHIKRTTIYHALNTLTGKGLVAEKGTGSRLVFVMTRPEHLERIVDKKIKKLEENKSALAALVPLLSARQPGKSDTVSTVHYDGIEGVKIVVDEALYCKSRQWKIISPVKNFFSDSDRAYVRYFMKTRAERGIKTKALWEPSAKWKKLSITDIAARQPRWLPDSFVGNFNATVILFDTSVALIAPHDNPFAVLIKSKEFSTTLALLFDALWAVSKPVKTVK